MSLDNNTGESQVNETPETTANTEQETTAGEPSVAELHEEKPKSDKPKVVPIARLDKEIAKRKELEAKLAQYESTEDDTDDGKPSVEELASKLEQFEKKGKMAELNKKFDDNLVKALENSPEYKDIVNPEVIRQMAFNPANAQKTFKQLLEEAYGNAVTGRRTIETTTPRGGAKDTKVDMKRAQTDTAYRHEVLADPDLRKQYNEGLIDRVFR